MEFWELVLGLSALGGLVYLALWLVGPWGPSWWHDEEK